MKSLFGAAVAVMADTAESLRGEGFARFRLRGAAELVMDRLGPSAVECAAVRFPVGDGQRLTLGVTGGHQLLSVAAGGWLLTPMTDGLDAYWIPRPPMLRRLDEHGHILSQRPAGFAGFGVSAAGLAAHLEHPAGHVLDVVIWRLPADEVDLLRSLQDLTSLERQRYFLWSSHTAYARPADLYLHWVHGHVYENHEVWPKYWRVCSELDAYALYVTLTGLLRATGKKLYELLRIQVVFAVVDRQAADGGWYHGEWTDEMESHFRLHSAAMHLLAAHFEETRDAAVGAALARAAAFAATKTDRLESGAWYLHDSLELSTEAMQRYPFRYVHSRALGKAKSNLLVLNTHLDTNIAMARHRDVSGDGRHAELIASACATTRAVLALRPADWLYRPLFRVIGLTFLPTERARALPLPLRALKRVAWKHLVPWLPRIKSRLPRLVMPGGYIERDLTMRASSVRYQPVNLMDLIRTRRQFDDAAMDLLLAESFAFTHECGITARWKELKGKEDDALGFWAEALYHLALAKPDQRYRAWLAQAILDLEDNGLGLPPSLLGSNAEAVTPAQQCPCPNPVDPRLRVANLSRGEAIEWLIVNPTDQAIDLEWETPPAVEVIWQAQAPSALAAWSAADSPKMPARTSLHGVGTRVARA
ncbi:MAG TPA: hypothetical protein PKC97_06155 [Burkholderiaceae bacterium]|nr:hypothetical protein [Burkholderiaceae bacterium]